MISTVLGTLVDLPCYTSTVVKRGRKYYRAYLSQRIGEAEALRYFAQYSTTHQPPALTVFAEQYTTYLSTSRTTLV